MTVGLDIIAHDRANAYGATKIVATLGPATTDDAILTALLQMGVDVVRLNFSHGTQDRKSTRLNSSHSS